MAIVDSFSKEALTDLFKNNLKLNTEQNLKYLIKKCSINENVLGLRIASKNEDFDLKHIMVKIQDNEEFSEKKNDYAKFLENVFTIQDEKKDMYLGFSGKGILPPSKNNLKDLTILLKSLAKLQANSVAEVRKKAVRNSDYQLSNVSDAVLSMDSFKALDNAYMANVVSNFQNSINNLFKNGLVVESIGNILANNVFIKDTGRCVFLNLRNRPKMYMSPLYDALTFIFALSDENFRQHNLKMLLSIYYQAFIDILKKTDITTASKFDINVFENHMKIVLPIVKFETAAYLILKENTCQEEQNLQELLHNILYCLKYTQASYEDCLEAISQKLGSTNFKLIDYCFIPLDERNGHLGEYFILKSQVNCFGKSEELSMFSKILNTGSAYLTEMVQNAVSKKEQFFFRTLLPLFRKYDLESLLDFVPTCYFDRLNDILILENLSELGYKAYKTNDKIGYDILKSAFLKAAKLHACSLILEDRMSKSQNKTVRLGDLYGDFMKDWLFETNDGIPIAPVNIDIFKPGLEQLIDCFADVLGDISVQEFHKRVSAIYDVFIERINYPAKQFRNVVCHGDFYASNFLTKHDENNKVENCRIIDFQALRYAPIAEDILMLAYCNTKKEVRDKYLDQLLEDYYQELRKILFDFDLDINMFYTHDEYMDCIKYMTPVTIIAALCYGHIIALPPEKKKEIFFNEEKFKYYIIDNKKEYIRYAISVSEEFTTYMRELIEDLYNICVK